MDQTHHGARAALYSALAAAFCYPERDRIDDLTDPAVAESLRATGDTLDLEGPVASFVGALADADRGALADVHTALFGLPEEGTYAVVPYEAAYTRPEEIGRQQRRIATVVGLLEAFDLQPGRGFDERQDHVAVELELMQVLAAERGLAVEEGEDDLARRIADAEATVLAEHLVDFVPALAHDVGQATDDPVYTATADLAAALVRQDHSEHERATPAATGGGGR